jgi:6,7-dimethyl-8-ribityllumazine synthase
VIEVRGSAKGDGLKIAVIVSCFNEFITKKLLDGAVDTLTESGVNTRDITVIWVPGCYELPAALAEVADMNYDAVVCIGAVIRGETSHFDFVAGEAARGIAKVARSKRLPVGFGVITAENTDQAIDRSGGKRGNKGREAALAALETADLFRQLRGQNGEKGWISESR